MQGFLAAPCITCSMQSLTKPEFYQMLHTAKGFINVSQILGMCRWLKHLSRALSPENLFATRASLS